MERFDYRMVNRRIRMYRYQRGWTQERLAEEADLSKNFISKLEAGGSGARLDVYYRIAAALGVSLDALVQDIAPLRNEERPGTAVPQLAEIAEFNPMQIRLLNDFLVLLRNYRD